MLLLCARLLIRFYLCAIAKTSIYHGHFPLSLHHNTQRTCCNSRLYGRACNRKPMALCALFVMGIGRIRSSVSCHKVIGSSLRGELWPPGLCLGLVKSTCLPSFTQFHDIWPLRRASGSFLHDILHSLHTYSMTGCICCISVSSFGLTAWLCTHSILLVEIIMFENVDLYLNWYV